jgi:cytochrome P450
MERDSVGERAGDELRCPVRFHPLDRANNRAPMEALYQLAVECPVSPQDHSLYEEVTLVSGYDAVAEVLQRRKEFSNRYGHHFEREPGDDFDGYNIFTQEGAAHRRVRRIVATTLSPALVKQAEPYIRQLSQEVVANIPESGQAEFRSEWASKIPGRVVVHLLGVPDSDHEQFLNWSMQRVAGLARLVLGEIDLETMRDVEAPFSGYIRNQLELRRTGKVTREDVLTRFLVTTDDEGNSLSEDEIVANAMFLLSAGNGTTVNLLLNMVHELVVSGQWERVRQDRSLVPAAVEESLRLNPPIQYMLRRPTSDTEVAGVPVEAGKVLALSNLGADIDPGVWGPDARDFRLDRQATTKHLGFGMGIHSCPGSAVGRKVSDIALNALLDRFEHLSLSPDFEWQRVDYFTSYGPRTLDVEW